MRSLELRMNQRGYPSGRFDYLGIIFAALLLQSAVAQEVSAQRSSMSTKSLAAVPAVFVEVEGIDSAAIADGLVPDSIVKTVEEQLAAANIPTLAQPEWQVLIGNPSLVVKFELNRVSQFLSIYRMTLELRQMSLLTRDTTKIVHSPTWSAGSILGSIGNQNLSQLGGRVSEMVVWFIEDYWAARDSRDTPVQRVDIGWRSETTMKEDKGYL